MQYKYNGTTIKNTVLLVFYVVYYPEERLI